MRPDIPPAGLAVEGLAVDLATDRGAVRAVEDVSLSVAPGECVALVGASGAGKTLTARAVLDLLPDGASRTAGSVRWHGRDLARATPAERRALLGVEIAYIPQEPALDPVMRVGRQLVEAMRAHRSVAEEPGARAVELLGMVGIAEPARRARAYPHELSGGMRQRVLLALALANDPALVIADEPTTALDAITQARILDLLTGLQREEGRSLLLVTHDLAVVAGVADRVLVMQAGRIVEESSTAALFARPHHPQSAALLAAVPRMPQNAPRRQALPR